MKVNKMQLEPSSQIREEYDMPNETVLLKQQVAKTADRLANEVMELQQRLAQGVQAMSPAHQIRKHPIPAVGAAALAGFVAMYWYPKVRPLAARIAKDFSPEIKAAGKVGAGILLEILRSNYEQR